MAKDQYPTGPSTAPLEPVKLPPAQSGAPGSAPMYHPATVPMSIDPPTQLDQKGLAQHPETQGRSILPHSVTPAEINAQNRKYWKGWE